MAGLESMVIVENNDKLSLAKPVDRERVSTKLKLIKYYTLDNIL